MAPVERHQETSQAGILSASGIRMFQVLSPLTDRRASSSDRLLCVEVARSSRTRPLLCAFLEHVRRLVGARDHLLDLFGVCRVFLFQKMVANRYSRLPQHLLVPLEADLTRTHQPVEGSPSAGSAPAAALSRTGRP
jgi:hypothetical protein